jgi:hypothetical protein
MEMTAAVAVPAPRLGAMNAAQTSFPTASHSEPTPYAYVK